MVVKTSKNFILTLNPAALEFYQDILDYLKSLSGLQYILVTEHLGQENKHYHVYVQYENSKRLSIRKLKGAHVEKCWGSAQSNIKYLMAEDDKHKSLGVTALKIHEEGEPRPKGGNFCVGDIIDLTTDELMDLPLVQYNCAKNVIKDFSKTRAKDFRKNVKVYWIQGPSGVGKTNKAIDIATEFEDLHDCGTDFIKYCNGFYLGTTRTAKVAIYDDFRDSHMKPSEFINLIDYNKHWMNIKGNSILNEYLIIIFTSVQKFSKLYRNVDDEPRAQWERRVQVIDMFPPETVHIGGLPVGYSTDFNDFSYETQDADGTHVIID